MKRINEYKKLFDIQQDIELKELKLTYKRLVKTWHPDKFLEDNPLKLEAEHKSRQIIDGYHFLVSIAPETIAENLEEYTTTINETRISDYKHKGLLLEITFSDGTTYEYFGVNKNVYTKFVQSGNEMRFAKRNIFSTYLYRKSKKGVE